METLSELNKPAGISPWQLLWRLQMRDWISYLFLTYLLPPIFLISMSLLLRGPPSETQDNPIPYCDTITDAVQDFQSFFHEIAVTPNTSYLHTVFEAIADSSATFTFHPSREGVQSTLAQITEFGGVGFSLSGSSPSNGSTWPVIVITSPSTPLLHWEMAARAVCENVSHSIIRYVMESFPHKKKKNPIQS
jgi:hypothetical protein